MAITDRKYTRNDHKKSYNTINMEKVKNGNPIVRDSDGSIESFLLKEKLLDLYSYVHRIVLSFPKRERGIGIQISDCLLNCINLVARCEVKKYKKSTIYALDEEVKVLQTFIRLASDEKFYGGIVPARREDGKKILDEEGNTVYIDIQPPLSMKKYKTISAMLVEIGKIIGGYIKYVEREN